MDIFNGSSFLAATRLAFASLSEHSDELNKLNVFPVPDGDTGLNMSRTLAPVLRLEEEANLGVAAQKASEEILKSSRGNSGTILATFFLGFATRRPRQRRASTPAGLIEAFKRGTEESYHSIAEPTEGTILTVMKDASSTLPQESIEATLEAMEEKAYVSLQNTPNLMPLLKKAGVVDAGGLGFCYVVESFHESILGKKMDVSASLEELSGTPKQDDDDLLMALLLRRRPEEKRRLPRLRVRACPRRATRRAWAVLWSMSKPRL
jgi:dihydroxyacetone kinase-like predicted kinase